MKGIYILLIDVKKNIELKIGSLGKIKFEKGIYAYVGSSQNNLEKRIKRHLSKNKKKFWHIDYLLDNKFVKIVNIFYKKARKSEECKIAKFLSKSENLIHKFGCSDCNCKTHLFRLNNLKTISMLRMKKYCN